MLTSVLVSVRCAFKETYVWRGGGVCVRKSLSMIYVGFFARDPLVTSLIDSTPRRTRPDSILVVER